MPETSIAVATRGVLPFRFLHDYQRYAEGDVAGLKIDVGDRLAGTFVTGHGPDRKAYRTAIARRATPTDLATFRARGKNKKRAAPELVAVEFETSVGRYRGPTKDKRADIAGFTAGVARRYCEGYAQGEKKVGAVAHYYIPPESVDEELKFQKPRQPKTRRLKRKTTALKEAPGQK